ncbi:MAG: archease [Thermoleophilia bacterium]|nr:archease [Thermoleophilia bacterium]
MPAYEVIEHTADVGIRAYGDTEWQAFENAALGMFSLITELSGVNAEIEFPVDVQADDHETLLVDWLNELLYIFESNRVLLSRFEVTELEDSHLKGRAWGEPIDKTRHELKSDIKAVTYHMLKVKKVDDRWQTAVIFDI